MAITLEAPETVHAGEQVIGVVRATRPVRVFIRRTSKWKSGRYGNIPDTHERAVTVREDGSFALPVLFGPLTYIGERADLVWSVVAEAFDGPDERVEHPFVLVAPRETTYAREATGGYRDRAIENTTIAPDFGENHVEGPHAADLGNNPLAPVFQAALRVFSSFGSRDRAGVSDVALDVTPQRVHKDEEILAKLAFTTHEEIIIESITFELTARERWGSPEEHEPALESRHETVAERTQLAPGPHAYEARFRVPPGAPASFATANVGVEWRVRATIQIDGVADTVRGFVIGVAPF